MIGRTNVGGGGNTFAFIAVTYTEGSVCTCSDGTRTIRAKGTAGSFVFNIPYAGTWTVSCSAAEETVSKEVIISTQGESISINLFLRYYLYKLGDEKEGWNALGKKANSSSSATSTAPTVNRETTKVIATETGSKSGIFYYSEYVDFTKHSKLIAEGAFVNNSQYDNIGLKIWSSIGTYYNDNVISEAMILRRTTKNRLEIELPTGIAGGYIGFAINSYNGSGTAVTCTITLEKCYLES